MKVLGYSGLDGSVAHAVRNGCEPGEERMVQGLDSAAALVVDGRVVAAAAEERFTGVKHANHFPENAIRFCLASSKLSAADLDAVGHAFHYDRYRALFGERDGSEFEAVLSRERQEDLWRQRFGPVFRIERLKGVDHHVAHAASAYFPSGFDEALCVVSDGMGEIASASVFAASGGELRRLSTVSIADSLGILYGLFTRHLGYAFNGDEYKVMGLAPYGDPSRYRPFFRKLVELHPGGRYRVRWDLHGADFRSQPYSRGILAFLRSTLLPVACPEEPSAEARDVAAALQDRLEEALFHWLGHWRRETGLGKLCYAGGVALNATFNGKLIASGLFDEVYVPAGAGDDGSALGAALWLARDDLRRSAAREVRPLPFYGPSYDEAALAAAIRSFPHPISVEELPDLAVSAETAARALAEDRIIGWFQGAMEFGPRALGNRSILGNPTSPTIRDRLNALVKWREDFRPFAPAVLAERASRYFSCSAAAPYELMLATCPVRPEWRDRLPGITHVDGSARVQTVDRRRQPELARLLEAFGAKSGVEVVVNTSFNVRGQPIVLSPELALETFHRTRIDELYLGRFRIRREGA